jgi:hypothetical protein
MFPPFSAVYRPPCADDWDACTFAAVVSLVKARDGPIEGAMEREGEPISRPDGVKREPLAPFQVQLLG